MNPDSFDIGEVVAQRWFQIAHGAAVIATLALPWAIVDDHSAPASAFVLISRLLGEVDHNEGFYLDSVDADCRHRPRVGPPLLHQAGRRARAVAGLGAYRSGAAAALFSSDAVTVWWGYAADSAAQRSGADHLVRETKARRRAMGEAQRSSAARQPAAVAGKNGCQA